MYGKLHFSKLANFGRSFTEFPSPDVVQHYVPFEVYAYKAVNPAFSTAKSVSLEAMPGLAHATMQPREIWPDSQARIQLDTFVE